MDALFPIRPCETTRYERSLRRTQSRCDIAVSVACGGVAPQDTADDSRSFVTGSIALSPLIGVEHQEAQPAVLQSMTSSGSKMSA